jgi:hypothetical protein
VNAACPNEQGKNTDSDLLHQALLPEKLDAKHKKCENQQRQGQTSVEATQSKKSKKRCDAQ